MNVGGDEHVYCVIGPGQTPDGTSGRWVDAVGLPAFEKEHVVILRMVATSSCLFACL